MDRHISQVRSPNVSRRFGLPQVGLLTGAFATAVVLAVVFRPGKAPQVDLVPQIESTVRSMTGAAQPAAPPSFNPADAQRQLADAMARFAATSQREPVAEIGPQGTSEQKQAPAVAQPQLPAPPIVASLPATPDIAPAAPAPTPSMPPVSAADMRRLAEKAAQAIRDGDIFGARLILERAIGAGDATALFALAETYDPKVLGRMNVKGVKGDPARARTLYSEALGKGIAEAASRIDALDR